MPNGSKKIFFVNNTVRFILYLMYKRILYIIIVHSQRGLIQACLHEMSRLIFMLLIKKNLYKLFIICQRPNVI
jgi:hypothetical protein